MTLRPLDLSDAVEIQRAVLDCPPLTLHTPYTYWVILTAGSGLCFGSWDDGQLAGFLLVVPSRDDSAFAWQIGVRPQFRRRGVSQTLLASAWQAARKAGFQSMDVTITASNSESFDAFASFADAHGLNLREAGEATCQGPDGSITDNEILFRLAPDPH